MDIHHFIAIFVGMLLLGVLAQPLARLLRMPFSALLVIVGYVSALAITGLGIDTGLRWHHIEPIMLNVFLPVLIFETALKIDIDRLVKNLPVVLLLAIPGMLLSVAVIAAVLFYAIGRPEGFPWIAALLCGAILSATDPVAVMDIFKRFEVSQRMSLIMEGESLFNDALAIVLFSMLLAIATASQASPGWYGPIIQFLYVFAGGLGVGAIAGIAARAAFHYLSEANLRVALTLALAYLAFIAAERWLHMSGVVAVLACGLLIGPRARLDGQGEGATLFSIWSFLAFAANALVFLLLGVTVTLQMFSDMWLAMLFGIVAVLLARAAGVFGLLSGVNLLSARQRTGLGEQTLIYWGGLRGAIAAALALSLPVELDYWYSVQSITYGVVVFSLFVQAPSIALVLRAMNKV